MGYCRNVTKAVDINGRLIVSLAFKRPHRTPKSTPNDNSKSGKMKSNLNYDS